MNAGSIILAAILAGFAVWGLVIVAKDERFGPDATGDDAPLGADWGNVPHDGERK